MVFHAKIIGVNITAAGEADVGRVSAGRCRRPSWIVTDLLSAPVPHVTLSTHDRRFPPSDRPGTARATWPRRSTGRAFSAMRIPSSSRSARARGSSCVNAAKSRPGVNYLGIELSRKYAIHRGRRLARSELANAKVWCGDARIGPGAARAGIRACWACMCTFPTRGGRPGTRSGGSSRPSSFGKSSGRSQPGGQLCVASDVAGVLRRDPRIDRGERAVSGTGAAGTGPSPAHALDYLTHFERKYRLEGRPIYQARFHDAIGQWPRRAVARRRYWLGCGFLDGLIRPIDRLRRCLPAGIAVFELVKELTGFGRDSGR